ncbi:MAG: phosphomannomutase/phosphoglucomutase, partial [Ruminococcus sp.]|nr:phosphomannomutase/phosphoglucomutase [Ruminococcus sp.]
KHYRYRRGYKNVIDKGLELNDKGINCPLAIETSGHAAMRENYFLDDGAYLCTKIIIKMVQLSKEGKSIESLTAELKEPAEETEIRFEILEEDFRACGEGIINDLTEYAEKTEGWILADDNREGVRVSFDEKNGNGWFLLRLSVHDPIMPLNIESDSVGGVEIIKEKLYEFLKTTKGLKI